MARKRGCGFGTLSEDGCHLIAATKPREHMSGDPGTWRTEYRVCCRRGAYDPVMLQRRTAAYDEQGNPTKHPRLGYEPPWEVMVKGESEADALQSFSEGSYESAESLHPIHDEHLRYLRHQNDLHKLRMETNQELEDGGHVGRLKRGLQDKYTAALKRAKLYSAAARDEAPPDKLAKIKDRFQREYLFEKAKAEEADHLAYTRLNQIGKELKIPFRPNSRVCRGRR